MKAYVIVIGLVALIVAGIVGFVMRDSAATSKRQTAEAEAVGLVAAPVTWFDGDDHQEGHTLTYAWVDRANAVHTETAKEISWYDASTRYKVCYNPQDPTDRKLYPADHVCGS
jgi:hypothetical protein